MVKRESTSIVWQGITVELTCVFEWPIETFCHIEVCCDQRLPITETGYKSHFMPMVQLNEYEGYVDFVRDWLEDASRDVAWRAYVETSRQGDLFDL